MNSRPTRWRRALAALPLVAIAAVAMPGPRAVATDLDELRSRAQARADAVSGLEHRLGDLRARQARLQDQVETASADIGAIELELHDVEAEYRDHLDRYVERAVEAYKSGSTTKLALLLSSQNLSQLFTIAEATLEAAEDDSEALARVVEARRVAERTQAEIDERKQAMLRKQAEVDAVVAEIAGHLAERRAALQVLTAEIRELERQARAAAALAAQPSEALLKLLGPAGPAPGIPDGFVGTGVSFEGIASWYGPGFEGNRTASGDIFDSSLYTAASKELPFGTWLYVTHGGRGVVVLINDRGPYVGDRILDLSRAAAEAIGIGGIGWIEAEILLKT